MVPQASWSNLQEKNDLERLLKLKNEQLDDKNIALARKDQQLKQKSADILAKDALISLKDIQLADNEQELDEILGWLHYSRCDISSNFEFRTGSPIEFNNSRKKEGKLSKRRIICVLGFVSLKPNWITFGFRPILMLVTKQR